MKYKIRRVKFINHPILKNLELDFCDLNGYAVDTVIIAGENGTGKSTILECLYQIVSENINFEADLELETVGGVRKLTYRKEKMNSGTIYIRVKDNAGLSTIVGSLTKEFKTKYPICGIFSDVDINFHAKEVSTVTSMTLDSVDGSRRSNTDFPKQINQLLIDIQALDDAELAHSYRTAKNEGHPVSEIEYCERMPRFTTAFNRMLEDLTYNRVTNSSDGKNKKILFRKNNIEFPIDGLSSGEKQIVYRGCFLLKDANAINGAFVFIDEPEISLHPNWQKKIMDYYKGIFTNEKEEQTSQVFAVTHSPFVIHNENRKNDKVIILVRDQEGNIIVKDKPEYFKCSTVEAVEDAFYIHEFSQNKPTVYLEGRTDEKYFNKALEVFEYKVPFQFKWIGYLKENGDEENTGKDALNKAIQFLIGRNLPIKNVCLFDCDTNKSETEKNNVFTRVIPKFENIKRMKKGIENALILDDIDVSTFYSEKIKEGDYGDDNIIVEFKKMEFCEYICALENDKLRKILKNLKDEIDKLLILFGGV